VNTLTIAGGAGGIIVFLSAIVAIGRGIFRQIEATKENTSALRELNAIVTRLESLYNGHETRISVLEDRANNGR